MNIIFSILLTLLCGVSCFEACVASTIEAFVMASTAMCLCATMFLITTKYPLFKD